MRTGLFFRDFSRISRFEFGPPVSNYDPRLELLRLVRVELKVQAMEEAGEIDKALDAFIGIHGLKDRLSREEKAVLRERLITITKATLLEDEWQSAYLGAMKTRIDVSIDGLRTYLLGEKENVATRDVSDAAPYGDPDLLSFTRDPKWQNFKLDPTMLRERASIMLEEELARQATEALAREREGSATASERSTAGRRGGFPAVEHSGRTSDCNPGRLLAPEVAASKGKGSF